MYFSPSDALHKKKKKPIKVPPLVLPYSDQTFLSTDMNKQNIPVALYTFFSNAELYFYITRTNCRRASQDEEVWT